MFAFTGFAIVALTTTVSAQAVTNECPELADVCLSFVTSIKLGGEGAAEIVARDAVNQKLFVVNNAEESKVDVVVLAADGQGLEVQESLPLSTPDGSVNSVTACGGFVAVAVEAAETGQRGNVEFFNGADNSSIGTVPAGFLPDMLTFNADCTKVVVANEGEPSDAYDIDPEGSITVIDTSNLPQLPVDVTDLTFDVFNEGGEFADLIDSEQVRIFGPGSTPAQDLEPEYVTIKGDKAWISCQENNAIVTVDLSVPAITGIFGLGFKNWAGLDQTFDASDKDGEINFQSWNSVLGMYQPDSIASYEVDGVIYIVTANEGDSRDYDGFSEEIRAEDAEFTPADLQSQTSDETKLGRLQITNTLGADEMGVFNTLYAFGGRSFSIFNGQTGELVYDSGDEFETIIAAINPNLHNIDDGLIEEFDSRSDAKGPEPKALAVGKLGDRTFAFIGMERNDGIFTYEITDPTAPVYQSYINQNDGVTGTDNENNMIAPEGMIFVPANESPMGVPFVIAGYEVSGTVGVYAVTGRAVDGEDDDTMESESTESLTGTENVAAASTNSGTNVALIAGISVGAAVLVGSGVAAYLFKRSSVGVAEEAQDA
eukprot:Clim_evm11s148 gene=Clim_evmTU11s148